MSDRIRKDMPAGDSKKVPVAMNDLTTPLARRMPSPQRMQLTGTSPAGCHVNTDIQAGLNNRTNKINNKII